MAANKNQRICLQGKIPMQDAGQRLDQSIAKLFPSHSRSRIQEWIKKGQCLVNGDIAKPKDKIIGGESIAIDAPLPQEASFEAQAIALEIIYEDEELLIINKPCGLVVHPAAGNYEGTLLNALLYHEPNLAHIPRAGIVHRLDKDTSGIMMVAKTLQSHTFLVRELQARKVKRIYEAVTQGVMTAGGTVDAPMARHPKNRLKMAVVSAGKPAVTHYRLLQKFPFHTHIQVALETGRTHQIRVHMAYLHYPLVGDKLYNPRQSFPKGMSTSLKETVKHFPRQALHAKELSLIHPKHLTQMTWSAPLPEDFNHLIHELKRAAQDE